MSDASTNRKSHQLYQHAIECAMRRAARQVPWDRAFEIAHDVATELVRRSAAAATEADAFQATEALIHRGVAYRLRTSWRAPRRRRALDGAHRDRIELASASYEPLTTVAPLLTPADVEAGWMRHVAVERGRQANAELMVGRVVG